MLQQFLTAEYLIAFVNSIFRMSTPLIFCAMGALIADHAGTMNMALEGIMLTASFTAVFFSALTNSVWGGILGAILGGAYIVILIQFLRNESPHFRMIFHHEDGGASFQEREADRLGLCLGHFLLWRLDGLRLLQRQK